MIKILIGIIIASNLLLAFSLCKVAGETDEVNKCK